ncbi:hypothetical protein QYE76_063288 [Lolium multiflorum]|uniref:DUF3615 domain-containing protein n=1 Tax=Lolium multiflorum TaxID=4521 RepID=A0AAD8W6W2_LOLMU|nr:hypothetical protein QYE76_063288 [Lolium multiflorum]
MTGLHDKRATTESRRSKRVEQSRPKAAAAPPPPARRITRAEHSVPNPAARVSRLPQLSYGERDSEDAAPAPPPPKRCLSVPAYGDGNPMNVTVAPPTAPRAEAPAPPPRSAYALRIRHVPDTSSGQIPNTSKRKPYMEEEELELDRPCSSRNKAKEPEPWKAISCARAGLEHYNSMNQGDEHELIKAVGVHSFIWCGGWLHANFIARRDVANNVPKYSYFFAELELNAYGLSCASCVKLDSVEPKNLGSCGVCPGKIMHPAAGVYHGAKD